LGFLLQLAHQGVERRLGGVAQVGAVERERHVHGVRELADVAVVPEPGEPAVHLVGAGAGTLGGLAGLADALGPVTHRDLDAVEALTLLLRALVDPSDFLLALGVGRCDPLVDLGRLLAHRLVHPASGGHTAGGGEQHGRGENADSLDDPSHRKIPPCLVSARAAPAGQSGRAGLPPCNRAANRPGSRFYGFNTCHGRRPPLRT
jgi:hypothetical protein